LRVNKVGWCEVYILLSPVGNFGSLSASFIPLR